MLRVGLWRMIVVFPDHTHFLQRSRCFRILCVIINLDSGVHDYALTKIESGAKIWSVKYIYPTYLLKLLSILKRRFCCCLFKLSAWEQKLGWLFTGTSAVQSGYQDQETQS